MKKIKPLGTTDLQFRFGVSLMTIIVIMLIPIRNCRSVVPKGLIFFMLI